MKEVALFPVKWTQKLPHTWIVNVKLKLQENAEKIVYIGKALISLRLEFVRQATDTSSDSESAAARSHVFWHALGIGWSGQKKPLQWDEKGGIL